RYRECQQRQSQNRHEPVGRHEPVSYGMAPPATVISDMEVPVIAGLATMPSRVQVLREAFNSIYWQVDEVYVFLNNFDYVPGFLKLPGVKMFRSQEFHDYKDVG